MVAARKKAARAASRSRFTDAIFLKSAGGKRKLAPRILEMLPTKPFVYHEPFVGGGAVFFALEAAGRIDEAHLSDANPDLMAAWQAVATKTNDVVRQLRALRNDAETYQRIRVATPRALLSRGARFIYLNKTSYGGLWRVNRLGEMNAPFGKRPDPMVHLDEKQIRAAAAAMGAGVHLRCEDFSAVHDRAKKGDVAYFDPPYAPVRVSGSRSFTGYTPDGFSLRDHEHLHSVARALAKRGVRVVLSNSSASEIVEMYSGASSPFTVHRVHMPRSVNSKASERGEVPEILVTANL